MIEHEANLLFTLGEWCIYDRMNDYGELIASHHCVEGEKKSGVCWLRTDMMPICFYCCEPVPDEIQALMILRGSTIRY
jgi:hypothetical protein